MKPWLSHLSFGVEFTEVRWSIERPHAARRKPIGAALPAKIPGGSLGGVHEKLSHA